VISRLLSTVGLWSIVILSLYFLGAQAGVWLIALLTLFTQWEFYGLLQKMGHRVHKIYGVCWSPILILGSYYLPSYYGVNLAGVDLITLAIVITLLIIVKKNQIADQIPVALATLFGILYIPFLLSFFIQTLFLDHGNTATGLMLALWIVVTTKFSDVGALLTGMAIGRHKMASNLSPKKTWEGVAGGILLSMLVGALLPWCFASHFPTAFTPWIAFWLAMPVAMIAVASDLIESVIKRVAGVKDSGHAIPGIGGAFDLTDSLILSAPIAYLLMKYLVFT
jgi:phosphatidate cytidylyltransferase